MHNKFLPLIVALAAIAAAAILAILVVPAGPLSHLALLGAASAAYMAINVGANDVANNMGPAVGAKALRMGTALLLAATFDVAGALLAGQGVIDTVSQELLSLDPGIEGQVLVLVMIAATLAAALWISLSTFVAAPVSTTHAIVGGVVGAGIAAAGFGAVEWRSLSVIAFSWLLSPLLGGLLAAGLHTLIRRLITRRRDKLQAARLWVPVLIAAMSGTFALYLQTLFQRSSPAGTVVSMSLGISLLTYWLSCPWVSRRTRSLDNTKREVGQLFRPPLIGAAALLSFAHGTNDVANAVAPLAAIMPLLSGDGGAGLAHVPLWIMAIGAGGIAVGILCFGPRVIHTVGEQITKLNEIRAFCVALAAAVTVLAASVLGLPVSSTHVAVGAVFGVGFLREFLAIRNMHDAAVPVGTEAVSATMLNDTPEQAIARERRGNRRHLVRRLDLLRIVAAWAVTMPASACLAALIFGGLSWLSGAGLL
jgi:PiT family inorganic phosphate transporter